MSTRLATAPIRPGSGLQTPRPGSMRLEFTRGDDGRHCLVTATPPHRRTFRLSVMPIGRDLPHDLATAVVEATYACAEGFVNLTAHGATFRSGDRRRTAPGRGLIRDHAAGLTFAEGLVGQAVDAWRQGRGGLAAPALDAALAEWEQVPPGAAMIVDWAVLPLPRLRGR